MVEERDDEGLLEELDVCCLRAKREGLIRPLVEERNATVMGEVNAYELCWQHAMMVKPATAGNR
eukprot:CAMPEP_0201944078 /NCGR_PEP_ID=MMETSP0903-20130614/52418_1 /ASSEMBLY_ACC=CAM_ASM_000552 /TAXON_ID=420261 /ORGANISM="Thalassiosira antarctica, Strain CCMP982" /LENGTH=63 /DNA_ID=CAMNT_0048486975 /DNA_START=96 /DNA_END=283 /DNA_ORIENTATION=-